MIHIAKHENDKLFWKFSTTDEISSKLIYQHYVKHVVVQDWLYKVCDRYIPHSRSFLYWRLLLRRLLLDCYFRKLGFSTASRCHLF